MPVEVEPPELARLIDFAERPRTDDWSLRSALVRYAQPQPERASAVLDVVRRIESALSATMKLIGREGRDLWHALEADPGQSTGSNTPLVELLRAVSEFDRLGDVLAHWAVDRASRRPDAEVDSITAETARRLDGLGLPREDRLRPASRRG